MEQPRQPFFNAPAIVVISIAALFAVHILRIYGLSEQDDVRVLLYFAFIPARYEPSLLVFGAFPGGLGAQIWTFVTYGLLHGDFIHLGFNSIWLLAFGTPLARRFGALRFLVFCALTAAAGAAAHLITHPAAMVPMVGASASISGAMAASMRFAFQRGGPIFSRGPDASAYRVRAMSFSETMRNPGILMFLFIWFGINYVFSLGSFSLAGEDQSVAWQAHVGGFVAGLVLFGLLDPVKNELAPTQS